MVVEALVIGAIIALVLIASVNIADFIAFLAGRGMIMRLLARCAGAGIAAYVLLYFGTITITAAYIFPVIPLVLFVLARSGDWWVNRKAMNGDYGEEVKWAVELVQGGDEEFKYVTDQLPKHEMREVLIIAESKEELRELAVERYEELTEDESVGF